MMVAMGFAIWKDLLLCAVFLGIFKNGVLAMSNVIPTDYTNLTCQLSSGKEGICVYAYLCQDDVVNIDGNGIIDLRFSDECEDYFLKCCSRESPCLDNTGTCVAKNQCGADLNAPKYKKFRQSEECDWSGYHCCPNDEVGKGDSTGSDAKEDYDSESDCEDGTICVPDNQCLVDPDGTNSISPRFSGCSGSNTCCPKNMIKKTGANSCEMIGGTCVQNGQCESPYEVDVRTDRCPEPGYECCMDNAPTTQKSTEGKKCFNNQGTCTQSADCGGTVYRDRKNECDGLTCCGSPRSTTPASTFGGRTTTEQEQSSGENTEVVPTEQPEDNSCDSMGGTCQVERKCRQNYGTIVKNAVDCSRIMVCCKSKDSAETPTNSRENSGEGTSNSGEGTKNSEEDNKNSEDGKQKSQEVTNNDEIKECGYRNETGIKFDTINRNDGESQYGEFPWMVAIMVNETGKAKLSCGGTLIDPEVVITTAECVKSFKKKPEELIIRAGEWDMGATMEPFPHQERRVVKVKIHAEFRSTTLVNNIALLFLDDKYDLSSTINTVCLPPQDFSIDNGELTATGWGTTPQNRKKYQQILKSIDLPYTQKADCERTLRRATGNRNFKLHPSFMCAGGEAGVDTCKGDAGSPVIFQIPDETDPRYYAVAMVSWGIGCGRPGVPAAYTDIGQFREWIDKEIEIEGVQTNYYEYQKQNLDDNE